VIRFAPLDDGALRGIALGHLARVTAALCATARLDRARLPALRQAVLAALAGARFPGGARDVQRLVERIVRDDRPPAAPPSRMTIVYPYHPGGRNLLAAGVALAATPLELDGVLDAVLTHPAGSSLLYVAHDDGRVIALVGDADAARQIAGDLRGRVVPEGRFSIDVAGRAVGGLVDELLG
jgi:hypothetical protein